MRQRLLEERRKLAESLLAEVEDNLVSLSRNNPLKVSAYEIAREGNHIRLFSKELIGQIQRTYEKVETMNDALRKCEEFKSSAAEEEDYETKNTEFQQFLAWYRGGLATSLQLLKRCLKDEIELRPKPESVTNYYYSI